MKQSCNKREKNRKNILNKKQGWKPETNKKINRIE
jgi:hypothetical protein